MIYSCVGLVEVSLPDSTRPGWERQASGVDVGISVAGMGIEVVACIEVEIGGILLGVGAI